MNGEVLIDGWEAGGNRYNAGDIVDIAVLHRVYGEARVAGFQRLGFFRIVEEDLGRKLKKDLVEIATERGLEFPSDITKPKLLELLEAS
jgi:hypothetical protein